MNKTAFFFYKKLRILSELDKKNPLSLIFISFSNDLPLKKETYKAIKSEERGQNITKYREVVRKKLCYIQNHVTSRRWSHQQLESKPSWFIYKCNERYTLCLHLVSAVTPEMEMKAIALPVAILHLYQNSYRQKQPPRGVP